MYGGIAPLAGIFVYGFFKCAYKVFRYMTLFIYGKTYETGGGLFYELTAILFCCIYIIVLVIVGYLSVHGTGAMAGIFSVLLLIVMFVHLQVHQTFIAPSKTLSLALARTSDDNKDRHRPSLSQKEPDSKFNCTEECRAEITSLLKPNFDGMDEDSGTVGSKTVPSTETGNSNQKEGDDLYSAERTRTADQRMQARYGESDDTFSDISGSDSSWSKPDFFIYRQPSLNRATWELEPRPYRDSFKNTSDGKGLNQRISI